MLDAEFALVLYDVEEDSYIAARDPIGIRPLYYGITKEGTEYISKYIKDNQSLMTINIEGNYLCNEGIKIIYFPYTQGISSTKITEALKSVRGWTQVPNIKPKLNIGGEDNNVK